MTGPSVPLSCRELVELVTDYLEGALPADEQARFQAHLEACDPCVHYIEQIRLTVRAAGRIEEDDLDPVSRDALLAEFRGWKRG
jgi:anti-sigma factor RsiW